jgi:excisionase family DNA binding protein
VNTSKPEDRDGDRLFSLAEAANFARVGQSTLRQAIYKGVGPRAYKLPGCARWRFRRSDIEKWINAGEVRTTQLADELADA